MDLKQSDIILIMLGTNGGHSMMEETEANQAYEELLRRITEDVPSAQLYLLTPPHATTNREMSNSGYSEQVRTAAEYVRNLAKKRNLPLIDVAGYEEFCEANEYKYQSNDGLHFVEAGYRELARFVAQELRIPREN